jgi:hypothetical protein
VHLNYTYGIFNLKLDLINKSRGELGNTALHNCSIFDNVEPATCLIEKGAKTTIVNRNWDTPITILARNPPETTTKIYEEVNEPLLRMQFRVSGSEFNDFFSEKDPINIEDNVLL